MQDLVCGCRCGGLFSGAHTFFFLFSFIQRWLFFLVQSGPTAVVSDDAVAGRGPLLLCETDRDARARTTPIQSVAGHHRLRFNQQKKKMIRVTYRLVLGSDVDYDVNKEAGDVTSGQMTGRTVRSHVGPSRDSQTNATFPL